MKILNIARNIIKNNTKIKSLIEINIYKENLIHNINEYKKLTKNKINIVPVLKSNAYGHGLVKIADALKNEKLEFFVVDSLYEARILRDNSIKNKILVIGYSKLENILKNDIKNISFVITSLDQLKVLNLNLSKQTSIHLKIDTGMRRQGIMEKDIEETIKIIKTNKLFVLEGVCSHFPDADNQDTYFTENQIQLWNKIKKEIEQKIENIKYFHISASAGGFFWDKIDANLMRLGIGLCGINVSNSKELDLKPVLELKTIITGIKNIDKGDFVGYSKSFQAKNDMKIGTIPMGYFEGIDRRLSNIGQVKVNEIYCNLIGRISMNISTIDLSQIENVKLEDEVIVISKNKEDENSVENLAKLANTIPYEILIHLPQHIRRSVV